MKTEKCTKCGKPVTNPVWIEMSLTDGKYYHMSLPKGHESQGSFPFGSDCVKHIKDLNNQ